MDARIKAILLMLTGVAIIATVGRECLAADGAAFLTAMLIGHQGFVHHGFVIIWPSRLFSQAIPQVLPWIAIHVFGFHNRLLASYLYGFSLYGFPILSLYITYILLDKKYLFILPLASYIFSTLLTYWFIISESNVMSYVFWMIIALLSRDKIRGFRKAFLFVLIVLSVYLYNSFIFLSLLWFPLLIKKSTNEHGTFLKAYWYLLIATTIFGYAVAVRSALHPLIPGNESSFIQYTLHSLPKYTSLYILVASMLLGYVTSSGNFYNIAKNKYSRGPSTNLKTTVSWQQVNYMLYILIPSVSFAVFVNHPEANEIFSSFKYLALNIMSPFVFGFIFMWFAWNNNMRLSSNVYSRIVNGLMLSTLVASSMQLAASFPWYRYTSAMSNVVNKLDRPINNIQPSSMDILCFKNPVPPSAGGWTYGPQSVLFASGHINTVLYTPFHMDWWSPTQLLNYSRKVWG